MFSTNTTLTTRKHKMPWLLPTILILLALISIGGGLLLSFMNNRTEHVLMWARPVVAGQQITAEDFTTVELPINRPSTLASLPQGTDLLNFWITRNADVGELIAPSQVTATAPNEAFYPNGVTLPKDMVALPFSLQTVGPVTDRDTINVNFIDGTGDAKRCESLGGTSATDILADAYGNPLPTTCRLLPQMPILYIDQLNQIAYLAATPYQSQAVYTLSAISEVQLYGERYGSTSNPLPYLSRLDPTSIQPAMLTGSPSMTNHLLPGFYENATGER